MHTQRVVVIVAAVAGMLATFLPWVSLAGIASAAGTDFGYDGWVTLGAFAVVLGCAFSGSRTLPLANDARFAIVLFGLGAGIFGLHDLCHVRGIAITQIGPGLYLEVIAAAVATGAAAWVLQNSHPLPPVFAIVVVIFVVFAGAVHITYGADYTGPNVCSKSSWSLADTFVDVDDYIGHSRNQENAGVVDALAQCGALHVAPPDANATPPAPAPPPPSDPSIGSRCVVENAETVGNTVTGTCLDLSDCPSGALYYRGYCPGPASEVCCTTQH